jgi:hypothetical protein
MENHRHITTRARVICAVCFAGLVGGFLALNRAAAKDGINIVTIFGPCGFKQRYDLPCPACGMTTAAVAFARGRILQAFYIQPAAAFLCCLGVVFAAGLLSVAATGSDCVLLKWVKRLKAKYIITIFFIIMLCGWAVTLVRALGEGS